VNAVRWASVLALTMRGRSSWSARSLVADADHPDVWAKKKAMFLGEADSAAIRGALVLAVFVVDHDHHAAAAMASIASCTGKHHQVPPLRVRRLRGAPPRSAVPLHTSSMLGAPGPAKTGRPSSPPERPVPGRPP